MRRFTLPTHVILLATLAILLAVGGASAVQAGGEKCQKAAEARQASYADCEASAEECLSAMAARIASKGWAGFETEKDTAGHYRVVRVDRDSPAAAAGLRAGDVLLAMNGLDLYAEDKTALKQAKKGLVVGSAVKYKVVRDGTKKIVAVTLAEVPSRVMAQWIGEHMLDQHAHVEVASAG